MARTVAEIDAEIIDARAAISACRKALKYGTGQNSKEMPRLPDLERNLNNLLREKASASGLSQVSYPAFASKS